MEINPGLSAPIFDVAATIGRLELLAQADGQWHPRDYSAGAPLFAAGDAADRFWVMERGLVKLGYLTPGGDDWIKSFIADQGLFTGSGDLASGGTNRYGACCLEPSRIAALPIEWVIASAARDPALSFCFAQFATWLQVRKQRREELLLCASAEDRYRIFLAENAELAARLRQADIARYIGVTAIALSRIRKRLGLTGER